MAASSDNPNSLDVPEDQQCSMLRPVLSSEPGGTVSRKTRKT